MDNEPEEDHSLTKILALMVYKLVSIEILNERLSEGLKAVSPDKFYTIEEEVKKIVSDPQPDFYERIEKTLTDFGVKPSPSSHVR